MRRLNLTLAVVLLAAPAAAAAKVGVEFRQDPTTIAPGERHGFTVMLYRDGGGPNAQPKPVAGRRPLVTFENVKSGATVRVRTRRTDSEGIATASVTFPSRGEWKVNLGDIPGLLDEGGQTIPIGIPFAHTSAGRSLPPETVAPPASPRSAIGDQGSGTWPVAAIAVALTLLVLLAGTFAVRKERPA